MTDPELVAKRLAIIETSVRELWELARPEAIDTDIREARFVEHTLQIALQATLDAASHIVSDERLGEPSANRELFDRPDRRPLRIVAALVLNHQAHSTLPDFREYLFEEFIALTSQAMDSPVNPSRFNQTVTRKPGWDRLCELVTEASRLSFCPFSQRTPSTAGESAFMRSTDLRYSAWAPVGGVGASEQPRQS